MRPIGIISDTHGLVRPQTLAALAGCRMILHAGDIGGPEVLAILQGVAPVLAVWGNVDHGGWTADLPEMRIEEIDGTSVCILHDLHQLDLDPSAAGVKVVVSGHTHRPSVRTAGGVLYVNPGSAGPRRLRLPVAFGAAAPEGGGAVCGDRAAGLPLTLSLAAPPALPRRLFSFSPCQRGCGIVSSISSQSNPPISPPPPPRMSGEPVRLPALGRPKSNSSTINLKRTPAVRRTFVMLPIALLLLSATANAEDPIATSVVKIHSPSVNPTSSGRGARAMPTGVFRLGVYHRREAAYSTNAHVVTYASQIFVQADQSTDRVPAKVVAIAPIDRHGDCPGRQSVVLRSAARRWRFPTTSLR